MDPYEILGIPKNSNFDIVKQAYIRAAKECHPDKGGDVRLFTLLDKAYRIILNNNNNTNSNVNNTDNVEDRRINRTLADFEKENNLINQEIMQRKPIFTHRSFDNTLFNEAFENNYDANSNSNIPGTIKDNSNIKFSNFAKANNSSVSNFAKANNSSVSNFAKANNQKNNSKNNKTDTDDLYKRMENYRKESNLLMKVNKNYYSLDINTESDNDDNDNNNNNDNLQTDNLPVLVSDLTNEENDLIVPIRHKLTNKYKPTTQRKLEYPRIEKEINMRAPKDAQNLDHIRYHPVNQFYNEQGQQNDYQYYPGYQQQTGFHQETGFQQNSVYQYKDQQEYQYRNQQSDQGYQQRYQGYQQRDQGYQQSDQGYQQRYQGYQHQDQPDFQSNGIAESLGFDLSLLQQQLQQQLILQQQLNEKLHSLTHYRGGDKARDRYNLDDNNDSLALYNNDNDNNDNDNDNHNNDDNSDNNDNSDNIIFLKDKIEELEKKCLVQDKLIHKMMKKIQNN